MTWGWFGVGASLALIGASLSYAWWIRWGAK